MSTSVNSGVSRPTSIYIFPAAIYVSPRVMFVQPYDRNLLGLASLAVLWLSGQITLKPDLGAGGTCSCTLSPTRLPYSLQNSMAYLRIAKQLLLRAYDWRRLISPELKLGVLRRVLIIFFEPIRIELEIIGRLVLRSGYYLFYTRHLCASVPISPVLVLPLQVLVLVLQAGLPCLPVLLCIVPYRL